jgi:glycosyltransferase involved in cell wall biosynthesis
MRFSLVVCTRDRRNELVDLLDSLVRQNRTDFEVILVDQNTDNRLVEILARFAGRFPLKHIRMTGTGASRARNAGLDHVTGQLIGFPDDDCRYLDGYLEAVDQIFTEDPSIGCISGHPTAASDEELGRDWQMRQMDLDWASVLNRCQEFTIFVQKRYLRDLRYNERLGVGAQTLWGAEEGPDFLIRLIQTGARLVYFPRLFVYHPNKVAIINRSTLQRAASYARGRGCLFRLHRFPRRIILISLIRPAIGCSLYLLKFQPMRSAYYFAVVRGTLRGLLMSKAELADVRDALWTQISSIEARPMRPLPPQPLVSVLIANYNYARFLPAALDALLAQTYAKWHAIVCDDGSTDHSVQVIQQYADRDPRIQLLRQSNGGQNSAFNACYQGARGEIVCFLDADDAFEVCKIQRVVETFLANPEAGICNHFSKVINAHGCPQPVTMHRLLDSGWLADKALRRGACVYVPTTSCMSIRRDISDALFPIPPYQQRDLDGYVAMASQFLAPICVLDEQLSSYRVHAGNMGGLTEPTLQRLRYELQLIELRTSNVKHFVKQRYGEQFAERIVLEDNPQYIQAALKLLAIGRAESRLQRALALIRRHPNVKWRVTWHLIFAAPETWSRLALPWIHRSYRVKAFVHRLMGRGRLATP